MALFGENTVHAWANINCKSGQDTVRDSYNISSVTDTATGRQTFNFSTNAADNNYAIKKLNWKPERSIEDICKDSWNWIKKNKDKKHLK